MPRAILLLLLFPTLSSSMEIRHAPRLNLAEEARRKLLPYPEFFSSLAVDSCRPAFLECHGVSELKRRTKLTRLRYVFRMCTECFADLVIADIFLKEMRCERCG